MFRNGDTSKFWAGAFQVAIAFGAFDFGYWLFKQIGAMGGVVGKTVGNASVDDVRAKLVSASSIPSQPLRDSTIVSIYSDPANQVALASLNAIGLNALSGISNLPIGTSGLPAGYFPQPQVPQLVPTTLPGSANPLTLNLNDLDLASLFPQQGAQLAGVGANTGQLSI